MHGLAALLVAYLTMQRHNVHALRTVARVFSARHSSSGASTRNAHSVQSRTCSSTSTSRRRPKYNVLWSVREKTEHQYEKIWEHVQVETSGEDEETKAALVEAMRLQWAYGFPNTPAGMERLTHGFHHYPAGMQVSTC